MLSTTRSSLKFRKGAWSAPRDRSGFAVPLSESRFHRQRHPQHVGAVEIGVLNENRSGIP